MAMLKCHTGCSRINPRGLFIHGALAMGKHAIFGKLIGEFPTHLQLIPSLYEIGMWMAHSVRGDRISRSMLASFILLQPQSSARRAILLASNHLK